MAQRGARERIVYSCAQLVRTQGVTGTGLREVVARAAAPRGSLQHYFPGGKDQIVREALGWSAEFAAARVREYVDAAEPSPGGLLAAMVDPWRAEFAKRGYAAGCPLVAAAADVAASNDALRETIRDGFEVWLAPVRTGLQRMGVPAARAGSLALVMVSALEGAIVLARSRHEEAPLAAVEAELRPLLDAAAGPGPAASPASPAREPTAGPAREPSDRPTAGATSPAGPAREPTGDLSGGVGR